MAKFFTGLLYAALVVLLIGAADAASRDVACLGMDCPPAAGGQNTGADGLNIDVNFVNFGTIVGGVNLQIAGVQSKGASVETSASATPKASADEVNSKYCLSMDCEMPQSSPGSAPEVIGDDYVCILTAAQVIDHIRGFFYVPGSSSTHLRIEDTRVLTYNSLVSATNGASVSEQARYDATERANRVAALWGGAIFYLPQSNQVYAFVVNNLHGKVIQLVRIEATESGGFEFESVGYVENDHHDGGDNLPTYKIQTNELWQIDH
jgi:hypothetical protein